MLTVEDIKGATKGRLIQGNLSAVLSGVSIDTRTLKRKNVFVAVKGQQFNGHDFISTAIRKGARAIVISKSVSCPKHIAVIRVGDTTKALGRIAAFHRQRFSIPVIAVTGSTGKTTSKELIASILTKRFKVLKNVKTENNHFGVPLTLLKLNSSHKIVVLELGTNQPGDIRWLADIVRPTTTVFTNIGESHLAGLKNQSGVFREKAQLIKFTDPKGAIILNSDDPYLKTILQKNHSQRIIRYGIKYQADNRATRAVVLNNRRSQFQLRSHTFTINSPVYHNIYNALAAVSCGLLHKISYNNIDKALTRFRFRDARQEIIKCGPSWVIDDTYNANPLSLKSAIKTLDALHVKGKRIVVCADMLELGSRSKALHQSAGRMIAKSDTNIVLTVGRHARHITQSLNRLNGHVEAVHCDSLNEVHRRLRKIYQPGDAALVKGSRGMRMERTVTFIKTHFK